MKNLTANMAETMWLMGRDEPVRLTAAQALVKRGLVNLTGWMRNGNGYELTELGTMWINRELANAEAEAHELNPVGAGEIARRYFDLDGSISTPGEGFNGVAVECVADFLATLVPAHGWTGAHIIEGPDAFGEVVVRVWSMSIAGEGDGYLNDYALYATISRCDRINAMHAEAADIDAGTTEALKIIGMTWAQRHALVAEYAAADKVLAAPNVITGSAEELLAVLHAAVEAEAAATDEANRAAAVRHAAQRAELFPATSGTQIVQRMMRAEVYDRLPVSDAWTLALAEDAEWIAP